MARSLFEQTAFQRSMSPPKNRGKQESRKKKKRWKRKQGRRKGKNFDSTRVQERG